MAFVESGVAELVTFVAAHGGTILLGVSVLLALGGIGVALQRAPVARRRLGIQVAACAVLYLGLASVPLPRWVATPATETIERVVSAPVRTPPIDVATLRALFDEPAVTAMPGAPLPAPTVARSLPASTPHRTVAAMSTSQVLAWLWLCGTTLSLAWLGLGRLRLAHLMRGARPAGRMLTAGFDFPRWTKVVFVPRAVRPFCCGTLRPRIVLPARLAERPARDALDAVLRHELAHLRQRDPAVQGLFTLLLPILFFHPLLWWLRRDVRFCSELLADDAAVRGQESSTYVRSLVELAASGAPRFAHVGAVSVFRRPSEFYRRMQMLLQRESGLERTTSRARRVVQSFGVIAVLVACTGFLGVEARAQEPEGRRMQELRKENAVLRDQLAALRAELDELRRAVERVQVDIAPEASPRDERVVLFPDTPHLGHLFGRSDRAQAEEVTEEVTEAEPMEEVAEIPEIGEVAEVAETVEEWWTPLGTEVPDPLVGDRFGAARTDPYRVRAGDTLAKIAQRLGGAADWATIARLMELNPDLDPKQLRVGQVLHTQGFGRKVEPTPPPQDRRAGARSDSDLVALVELATRVVDIDGELELAQARLADVKSLVEAGREQTVTLREAELRVQTSKRKRDLVRSIVDSEIERLEAELTRLRALVEHGVASSSELRTLERRLALLTRIR